MTGGASCSAGSAGAAGAAHKKGVTVHITTFGTFSTPAVAATHNAGYCLVDNDTIRIVNSTKAVQQITGFGSPVASPINSEGSEALCIGVGTITVGLASDPAASLTVHVR
jgi:hypothetical protein